MSFLAQLIVSTLAVVITSMILPGVAVDSVITAVIVAAVLSLLNIILKPILIFLTIPITLLTMGLFLLIINAGIILLASKIVDGFHVQGFWTAFFFGIILSIITAVFSRLGKANSDRRN